MLSRYKEKDGRDLTKQISRPAKLGPSHIFKENLVKE
jgi:hypothetical protein